MEKLKKITILLVLFMLLMSINIYAADEGASAKATAEVTFTPSKTSVEKGETITITLSAKCETEIAGIAGILKWDKTKLEFMDSKIECEGFNSASGVDAVSGEYEVYLYANTFKKQADVAKLSFKVLDTVKSEDEMNVQLSNIELTNSNVENIEIGNKEVQLKLAKVQEELPKEEPKEEPKEDPKQEQKEETKKEEVSYQGEKNPSNSSEKLKDTTTADKVINKAGVTEWVIAIAIIAIIIAIVLQKKCKTYKGI